MRKNVLVVYYSRSGNTKTLAKRIAAKFHCDINEIKDKRNRLGLRGLLGLLLDGAFGRDTEIETPSIDPSKYDLVIIGTPVWNNGPSSAVRTYLKTFEGKFKNVAFFLTQSGQRGRKQVFDQMKHILKKDPLGVLAVRRQDFRKGDDMFKVQDFIRGLNQVVELPRRRISRGIS